MLGAFLGLQQSHRGPRGLETPELGTTALRSDKAHLESPWGGVQVALATANTTLVELEVLTSPTLTEVGQVPLWASGG